jgi:hypothetical protein
MGNQFVLDRLVGLGAVSLVAVGIAVTGGWFLDVLWLTSVLPGLATMKVNTACAFIAAGVALWQIQWCAPDSSARLVARALAVFTSALGGATLIEDIFALDLGIDQLIVSAPPAENLSSPGRMSPATAFNFLLFGLALFALKSRRFRIAACAQWLVIPPLIVSTLAIMGYAYGVRSLYQVMPYSSMAVHTALLSFLLGVSIIAADSKHGYAKLAASATSGGIVARRLIPIIPIVLFGLAWLLLLGERVGLYDHACHHASGPDHV